MSHFWHKPLNLLASSLVVVGVAGMSMGAANAARPAAVHHTPSIVIFSDQQFIDTLNPFQVGTVVDTESTGLTQPSGNLSLWNPAGKYIFLESSTPTVTKHKVYTFVLKSGMKWSNGDPITNNDFIYSWKLGMNANTGVCTGTCDNIQTIKSKTIKVKKKKISELVVTLVAPYAPALSNAIGAVGLQDSLWNIHGKVTGTDLTNCLNDSNRGGGFPGCDNAANAYEDSSVNYLNDTYVTAGPYQVDSYNGSSGVVTFKRNANYTGSMPGGFPSIPAMEFLPYGTKSALIAGAAAGETDITQDYSLGDVGDSSHPGTLRYYHNFTTDVNSNADPEVLTFNDLNPSTTIDTGVSSSIGPFTNPFVGKKGTMLREALLMSFDRAGLIQNTFAPVSLPVAQSLVSYCAPIICTKTGHAPYADNKVIKGAWDPLKKKGKKVVGGYVAGGSSAAIKDAKTLIGKAGYNNGNPLTIYLSSTTKPYRYFEQSFLQQAWQNLGSFVHVNTENIKSSHYFGTYANNGTLTRGHFEADIHGYGGVPPDPDGWKGNFLSKNCSQNPPQTASQANSDCFADKIIDKALYQAGKSLIPKVRQKWYSVFQEENVKQAYWTILAPLPKIVTTDGVVGHFSNDPWVAPDTWDAYGWT